KRGFDEDLKAVADANDGFAGFDEAMQRLGEVLGDLIGEDSAGGDVVAIGEPAGDGEELKIAEQRGIFKNTVEMNALRGGAGELESVRGFDVAIGSGGAKD